MISFSMNLRPFFSRLAVIVGVLFLLVGCRPNPRQALEGTVTLDDRPLESGYIQFRPLEGTAGPTAGAEVTDGHFTVPRHQGPFAGRFRVEITASRKTDRTTWSDLSNSQAEVFEQFLPPRYNRQSELTAEVRVNILNRFSFPLTSR